jgi:hypothetical protein
MKSNFTFSLILQSLLAVGAFAVTKIIPTDPGTGPTTAQFYSGDSPFFDGPKIDFVNGTSFDWWYFDAVSSDGTYQLTVTFYTTVATTLGFATGFGTTNFVTFTAMYPNGTEYQQFGFAGPVVISDGLFGIEGNWTGTGFTFQGTADLSYYRIDIDSPALGIEGSLTFNSVCVLRVTFHNSILLLTSNKVAPGHYPADPYIPGKNVSEHLSPVIGWANAIPDSIAKVDFDLAGVGKLKFTGSGYHDKVIPLPPSQTLFSNNVIELGNTATPSSSEELVLGSRSSRTILTCMVRHSQLRRNGESQWLLGL